MQDISDSEYTIDIKNIFQRAYQDYRGHFPLLISISLIYGICDIVANTLTASFGVGSSAISFLRPLIELIITSLPLMAMIYASAKIYHKSETDISEAIREVKPNYLQFVVVSLANRLMIGLGFILLLVPGIYLSTIFALVDVLVVLESQTFPTVFRRSYTLVVKVFWQVLLCIFVLVCIVALPLGFCLLLLRSNIEGGRNIFTIVEVFLAPFYINVIVGLYYNLMKLSDPVS